MGIRFVRADEIHTGDVVWHGNHEQLLVKVRDAFDGRLVLTLRPSIGKTTDLKIAPWDVLSVVDLEY